MEKIRLLLVDDEEELVYPMAERLEIRGFKVKVATKWNEALKYFDKKRYNVAIIDIKLPGMNGFDLMKMFFKLQPDLKVILISGHASEEDKSKALELGASALIVKPVKMNHLIETIKDILGIEE